MKKFILVHKASYGSTEEIIIPVKGIRKVRGSLETVNITDEEEKSTFKKIYGSKICLLDEYKDVSYDSPIFVLEDPKTIYNLIYNKKDIETY